MLRALCLLLSSLAFSGVVHAAQVKHQDISVLWSVDVDQRKPSSPAAFSMPALLLDTQKSLIVIGGRDRWVHVYGLDGWEERRIALQGPSDSGALALNNGLVVLADTSGRMYAVDPKQGNIVWKRQLTATFTGRPVAIGDDFLVQTTDNRIYRFSQDGEKRWSFSGQNSVLSMYLSPSPLVVGHKVYALMSNGDAVALKAANGDLIWKRQLLLSNDSAVLSELKAPLATPVLVHDLNVAGEKTSDALLMAFFQGEVFALSHEDGAQAVSLPVSLKTAPLLREDILYMADSKGFLSAYDMVKGHRVWKKRISAGELSGPVLWQDALWLTDNKGEVFRLSTDGELQSSMSVDGNIVRLPMVTAEGLLFRSDRGALYMVK